MSFDGLDQLAALGRQLLQSDDPVQTDNKFNRWVDEVAAWLSERFPNSGLTAEWHSQGGTRLVIGGVYYDDPSQWGAFRMGVEARLRWLGNLPSKVSFNTRMQEIVAFNQRALTPETPSPVKLQHPTRAYVSPERISALKRIASGKFDLKKLVRMCEELNTCHERDCSIAIIMLTRAIIDHVPPIFGCGNFAQVANNYPGHKSFKEAMARLDESSRKIADLHLHGQIRPSESLPNITQVDFSNDLDLLLAEVERILK